MEFNEQEWVSIVDYARTFNVSDMTVRRRIKTGKITAELFNGKYYIPKSEVDRRNARSTRPVQRDRPSPSLERPVSGRATPTNPVKSSDSPLHFSSQSESHTNARPISIDPQRVVGGPSATKVDFVVPNTQVTVSSERPIIELCKDTMRLARESEEKSKALFEEKAHLFQEKESNYKLRIQSLEQKVEDLELLVSVLETKLGSSRL